MDIAREPRLRDLMEEFLPQIIMTQIGEQFAFLGQAFSYASINKETSLSLSQRPETVGDLLILC